MVMKSKQLLLIAGLMIASTLCFAKPQTLDDIAAVANDEVITQSQLAHQMAIIKQNLNNHHTPLPPEPVLRKQVLEHMISLSLQKQLAKKYNMQISDEEVNRAIETIAAGQNISQEQLHSAVAADGLTFDEFREQIRDQLLIQRVQQAALHDKIKITDQEVENYMQLLKAQPIQPNEYHIQDILIGLPESPTSEQIQEAKQRADSIVQQLNKGGNFDQLAVAESAGEQALQRGDLGWRKLAELPSVFAEQVKSLQKDSIAGPIRAANGFHIIKVVDIRGDVQKHYAEEAHVRQIYLKAEPTFPAKVYRDKLQKLRAEIVRGADFVKMAETYSDDPVTASKGGDMGWVKPSTVSSAFAEQIAKLGKGQISQPFSSPAGWHLIQVLDKHKVEDTVDFKKDQVRAMIYQRKFNDEVQSWLQQLRNGTYVKIMDKSS